MDAGGTLAPGSRTREAGRLAAAGPLAAGREPKVSTYSGQSTLPHRLAGGWPFGGCVAGGGVRNVGGMTKLSKPMRETLLKIAAAMPLTGEKSLTMLPCHPRTAGALEDRKLIKALTSNTGSGIRWTLTEDGWIAASGLELTARGCHCMTPMIRHEAECPVGYGARTPGTLPTLEAEGANTDKILQGVAAVLRQRDVPVVARITEHGFSAHSRRPMECRYCHCDAGDHTTYEPGGSSGAMWRQAHAAKVVTAEVPVIVAEANEYRPASAADALLAEIEAWQAAHRYGDGLFLPEHHSLTTLGELWDAGRVVPGSGTSGPGGRLGWYSVRMIDADHAEALIMSSSPVPAEAKIMFGRLLTPSEPESRWGRDADNLLYVPSIMNVRYTGTDLDEGNWRASCTACDWRSPHEWLAQHSACAEARQHVCEPVPAAPYTAIDFLADVVDALRDGVGAELDAGVARVTVDKTESDTLAWLSETAAECRAEQWRGAGGRKRKATGRRRG